MNRETAFSLVQVYIKNENLVNHMLAVESAMVFYATKMNEPIETWAMTGLLHDFDWEIHPSAAEHPMLGAPILRENGVSEEIIEAILGHGSESGVTRNSRLAKALYACDEVTGLITAVALVRPSRSLFDLEPSSVKKKWKDRAFAAGANREEIEAAANEFGIELWEHIGNVILAMRGIAAQIGLAGTLQPEG